MPMTLNLDELKAGFETAYINGNLASALAYRPQFISNNSKEGKKVLAALETELMHCDKFQISVAFITMSGVEPLLQILRDLKRRGVQGEILTTNYLNFSDPKALEKLHSLSNITLKMYDVDASGTGFHTKGYIFKKDEIYRIITGSSNITSAALTSNHEWNTKIVSTADGEMVKEIIKEYSELWNSKYALVFDDFIDDYKERYKIAKAQRDSAKKEEITSLSNYRLQPNSMQVGFIKNLKEIVASGENRALLISATGTGKTFASAFAMRELGFKRVLFLVHRGQLARQSKEAYKRFFGSSVSMGLVGAGESDYDADYVFATVQTLNRDAHLSQYEKDAFDCIIIDEAHHVPADTYQKILKNFTPKLLLGMTATPDKRDENIAGRNVYEIFNHQIAYEIRLKQAMEENLLCPFHYFGITDMDVIGDEGDSEKCFAIHTSYERVKHIIEQADYYGYSGDKVKGLVFCSSIKETEELSRKFNEEINPANGKNYRTIALNGNASEQERQDAFERLAMDEKDASFNHQPLDYIFSVEILNEGVDIVEVNQVIMLRPTQSPIVFVQQLGRGLRKAAGKEYVVILDFIGNYLNNFLIPVALSGDRTYNQEAIRKYVISGNNVIPGASTIHFDEISKDRIFKSIDKMSGLKDIIGESYQSLKNRLGYEPRLFDFYEHGEVDPIVIIKNYKTYWQFMERMERNVNRSYADKLTDHEKLVLEYLSKTIITGVRPNELFILKELFEKDTVSVDTIQSKLNEQYGYVITENDIAESAKVLRGCFTSKEAEYQKYKDIDILNFDKAEGIKRLLAYRTCLANREFRLQVEDIVKVGLARYKDMYANSTETGSPFVLYERYSRRDVSLLMNYGRDNSSTMYGMSRWGDDVFIFVTYHKMEATDGQNYIAGKPDYADEFEDNMIFRWDSQMGKANESPYMQNVMTAKRKHLFVKKTEEEPSFYYMGQFDVIESVNALKEDRKGKLQPIAKVKMKMRHPVRDDILRYLQSAIE